MSSLDHMTLNVSDYARSKAFYKGSRPAGHQAHHGLRPSLRLRTRRRTGLLDRDRPRQLSNPDDPRIIPPTTTHVAFAARNRQEVEGSTRLPSRPVEGLRCPGLAIPFAPPSLLRRVRARPQRCHDIEAVFHRQG